MPMALALEALKAAYRGQVMWLLALAQDLETGNTKILRRVHGADVDMTAETAIDSRHRAGNLEAIILAYERLDAKGTPRPEA
jgi:hypothetical protein